MLAYDRLMDREIDWESDNYDLDREDDHYRANFCGADLAGMDLHDANLTEADLRGADLRGADLSGAYLSGTRLAGAVWSADPDGTRWPDGPAQAIRARSQEIAPGIWRVTRAGTARAETGPDLPV